MMRFRHIAILALLPATLLLVGCGGEKYPLASVTGTVTCQGKPLVGVIVAFTPTGDSIDADFPGKAATSITDENGEYDLSTYEPGDGAIVGQHIVALQSLDPSDTFACTLPGDLSHEVKPGSNTINIDLE